MSDDGPTSLAEALRRRRRAAIDHAPGPGAAERARVQLDFGRIPGLAFVAQAALVFPSGETELAPGSEPGGETARLVLLQGALLGAAGTAPRVYTDRSLHTRTRTEDPLAAFMAILNTRSVEILGRAMERYRPFLEAERAHEAQRTFDGASRTIEAIVGVFPDAVATRLRFPASVARQYAAHFALGRATPDALRSCLQEWFGLPVEIQPFSGRWRSVDEADQPRLGGPEGRPELASGFPSLVGDSIWDVASAFRVRLGPMSYSEFCEFLPGSENSRRVVDFVRTLAGPEFDFDLQICLHSAEVPPVQLDAEGAGACRLGFDTWLGTPVGSEWVGDCILSADAAG